VAAGGNGGGAGEPRRPVLGDYALPCFPLARSRRSAPPKIAAELAQQLQGALADSEYLESVRSDGGYLNFRVRASALRPSYWTGC